MALDVRSLSVRFAQAGDDNGKIKLRGAFDAAAGVAPATEDFTLILDLGGSEIYRATLVAGAIGSSTPGKFSFTDRSGEIAGLRSVRLIDRGEEMSAKTASAGLAITGPQAGSGAVVVIVGDDCFSSTVACEPAAGGKALRCN